MDVSLSSLDEEHFFGFRHLEDLRTRQGKGCSLDSPAHLRNQTLLRNLRDNEHHGRSHNLQIVGQATSCLLTCVVVNDEADAAAAAIPARAWMLLP